MCVRPLADLYDLYSDGFISKKEFEGKLFKYLLDNFERYHLFNGDMERWEDFLSWLYPRLARAIDLYRDMGSSFDSYINGLVNGAAREYRCREAEHYMTEYVCWQAKAEEMMLQENEPEYPDKQKKARIPCKAKPRHILFLLLKSYHLASDELVKRVAEATGMKNHELKKMIDELKNLRSDKEIEIEDLRGRLQCQHYRCLTYQKRLSAALSGTEYYERIKERFERSKKRFYTMKKRLGKMRTGASNRMIAELMGIPRGTVDSGLYAIKSRFSENTG